MSVAGMSPAGPRSSQKAAWLSSRWRGHEHHPSIYHCTFPPDEYNLPASMDDRLTYNPDTKKLYLHLFHYPDNGELVLPNYNAKISYAQLLNDDSEVPFKAGDNTTDLVLKLPKAKPPYEIPVIELSLK